MITRGFSQPSHLGVHCLQMYLYWSAGMKEVKIKMVEMKKVNGGLYNPAR